MLGSEKLHLRKVLMDLAVKWGLAGDIEQKSVSFDALVDKTLRFFQDDYGAYRGKDWQDILAARLFTKILVGDVFDEDMHKAFKAAPPAVKSQALAEAAALLTPRDISDIGIRPLEKLDFTAKPQAPQEKTPSGKKYPNFSPFDWDIDRVHPNKMLALSALSVAMHHEEAPFKDAATNPEGVGGVQYTFEELCVFAAKRTVELSKLQKPR